MRQGLEEAQAHESLVLRLWGLDPKQHRCQPGTRKKRKFVGPAPILTNQKVWAWSPTIFSKKPALRFLGCTRG